MSPNPQNKLVRTGIHVLVWLVLFLLPYLLFPRVSDEYWQGISHLLLPLLFYAAIFYTNYFFLTDKFLFEKKIVRYCLINAALILFILWLNWEFRNLLRPDAGEINNNIQKLFRPPIPGENMFRFFVLKDLFSFFIPIMFSIAIRATERWIKTETEKKEIVNKNLESELEHLRYQLQPHFFFNSLNNIYSLIEVSPGQAQETVHGLSKLMRYLLYETGNKKVELSQEIIFLENYIKLMELRLSDKTKTTCSFPGTMSKQYYIAPLLFIPMIENAYKHGVSATQPSQIYFNMHVKDDSLFFVSGNTNFPKNDTDISGSGIGLENLRKRLELLYPGKHKLHVTTERGNMFWVRLSVDLREE